jgi:hypothetical protein
VDICNNTSYQIPLYYNNNFNANPNPPLCCLGASAREGTWMHSVQCIISKMTERITVLRQKYLNKTGVVDYVWGILKEKWIIVPIARFFNWKRMGRSIEK